MSSKSYEINMTEGPLLRKLLAFSFPLVVSGILQLCFNAADIIVIGQFAGSTEMAAVGATASLYSLLINVFIGMATGSSILMSRFYGAKDMKHCKDVVHSSVSLSLICGLFLILLGQTLAPAILRLMGTPEDVLPRSVLYIRIIFSGMPVIMLYNFGSGILRAVGDTKRPLLYLSIAGVLNVLLNLFLIVVFHMGVAGVAIATITSQAISALLVIRALAKDATSYRLNLKKLYFEKGVLAQIIRIGVPAGLQSAMFSASNVILQSSVNSFGSIAMAGSTAAYNIEMFVYFSMNAVTQACISFTSQNYGARKRDRIIRVVLICLLLVILIGIVVGGGVCIFGRKLISLYSSNPEVIEVGFERLFVVCSLYFICGMNEIMGGALRGIGYSLLPTLFSVGGICILRILWVIFYFPTHRTMTALYLSYPVSWTTTLICCTACFIIVYNTRIKKEF